MINKILVFVLLFLMILAFTVASVFLIVQEGALHFLLYATISIVVSVVVSFIVHDIFDVKKAYEEAEAEKKLESQLDSLRLLGSMSASTPRSWHQDSWRINSTLLEQEKMQRNYTNFDFKEQEDDK